MQAVDAILAEEYGVYSTSKANIARKRKEPRRLGTPPLSFRKYREKHGRPDGKCGCYVCCGQNLHHRHNHTRCEVNKREKTKYLHCRPDKVPQDEQRVRYDPRQHCQIGAHGEPDAQLMVEIQELRIQRAATQPQ